MNKYIESCIDAATRQFKHNDDNEGFVIAYDMPTIDEFLAKQQEEIDELKARLAEQVVYSDSVRNALSKVRQLETATHTRKGSSFREAHEAWGLLNNLETNSPSPALLAKHDADVIDKAREEAIKGKLNNWSKSYILLGEYAGKLRKGEIT